MRTTSIIIALLISGCATISPRDVSPQRIAEAIRPNMPITEVDAIVGTTGKMDEWSGQTGYFKYRLPSGQSLFISCWEIEGVYRVHETPSVYLQEQRGEKLQRIKGTEPGH